MSWGFASFLFFSWKWNGFALLSLLWLRELKPLVCTRSLCPSPVLVSFLKSENTTSAALSLSLEPNTSAKKRQSGWSRENCFAFHSLLLLSSIYCPQAWDKNHQYSSLLNWQYLHLFFLALISLYLISFLITSLCFLSISPWFLNLWWGFPF